MILGSLETRNTCSKSWYSRWIACLTFQDHHYHPLNKHCNSKLNVSQSHTADQRSRRHHGRLVSRPHRTCPFSQVFYATVLSMRMFKYVHDAVTVCTWYEVIVIEGRRGSNNQAASLPSAGLRRSFLAAGSCSLTHPCPAFAALNPSNTNV